MPEENEDEGTPFGQDNNIFGSSKTAKGLFDASDDEDKESSGTFAAAISGKKGSEDPSEDADKESLHSSSKGIMYTIRLMYMDVVVLCNNQTNCDNRI